MFRTIAPSAKCVPPAPRVRISCGLGLLTFLILLISGGSYGVAQSSAANFSGGMASDQTELLHRGSDDLLATLHARWVSPPSSRREASHQKAKHHKELDPKLDVSKIGDRKVDGGLNLYSMEREQEWGHQLAAEIESESTVVTDPAITAYVNRVGQNIAQNSDAKVPFVIKVVDDDEINAYALPGGFLYVNTGLLLAVDNEAELASVMAHEIAHVAARHVTRNSTRAQILDMASLPLVFFGGPAVFAAREVLEVAEPLALLKFSRGAEREADLLGLEYCYKAGYDPQAFVAFFEKLKSAEKNKHNRIAKMFSSHPMTEDRIKMAQQEIAEDLPARPEYIIDSSDFEELKARLSKMEQDRGTSSAEGSKPTLRRRTRPTGDSSPPDDDGPVLKKRPPQNL